MLSAAVITPTIGSDCLATAVQSVAAQSYPCTHHVIVNGREHHGKARHILADAGDTRTRCLYLPEDTGKDGWYGHRIYGAAPFLVNEDIIFYLDEDNWYEPDHVRELVTIIQRFELSWAFSLRQIFDREGELLCNDDCESLGLWPVYLSQDVYHVDTSAFAIRREVAVQVSPAWYTRWGADRLLLTRLKESHPRFGCTGKYTLCYRLSGNPMSVSAGFFLRGNDASRERYAEDYPWRRCPSIHQGEIGAR